MRSRTLAVLAVLALLMSSCSLGDPDEPGRPDYEPVPDRALFEEIAELPGVERADSSFRDTFPDELYYVALDLSDDADALDVADRTYAILRQGRPRVGVSLEITQAGRIVDTSEVLEFADPIDLEERYGPQPGDGTPPGD